jgi:pimeloyl-ACP methyl ester carboxylesterase
MSDRSTDTFEALRLPVVPEAPRAEAAADLRARLHRRLRLAAPPGTTPMARAAGLEFEDAGAADGEAVLLLHAGTATAYRPLLAEPALTDRYRLIRPHRRGYAGSDPCDGDVTIGRHVDDALALLDHLSIDRAHVVGHSGSGVIALQLALDAPERVRSLVLEEPAIHSVDPARHAASRAAVAFPLERYRAGDLRSAIEMWMQGGISRTWRTDLARTVPGGPQQTVEDAAAFLAEVEPVVEWPFPHGRVAALSLPVLFVLAERSSPVPVELLRRFRSLVPHTEDVVIAEASHMLHTDRPAAVAAALRSFFDRHPGRGR